MITHVWCCDCGVETVCEPSDLAIGAVYQCPACRQIWGCVRSFRGNKAWIKIDEKTSNFHRLLGPYTAEELAEFAEDDEALARAANP